MRTGFALFVKCCEVPELLFALMVKLLMKEEKAGRKRMTQTENTLEIGNVLRADDLLPFQTNLAIKNIINESPGELLLHFKCFLSLFSPFSFHPHFWSLGLDLNIFQQSCINDPLG